MSQDSLTVVELGMDDDLRNCVKVFDANCSQIFDSHNHTQAMGFGEWEPAIENI